MVDQVYGVQGGIEDAATVWLRTIGRTPLLTVEQEIALSRCAAAGCHQCREALIQANLRLVVSVCRKFIGRGLPLNDLIQEGNIGLMKAIERFDPSRGYRLSTYALWWIKQSISRAVQANSRCIRVPYHVATECNKVSQARTRLSAIFGREPTDGEIAREIHSDVASVAEAKRVLLEATVSLDQPLASGGGTLADVLSTDAESDSELMITRMEHTARIAALLAHLDPKGRQVIELRYGLLDGQPLTLNEVSERMHLTRERVRQIEATGLRRLRATVMVRQQRDEYRG
ncbi:MAG: sigma-70 family RNA polymerase sigma factor [Chthonomonas sp.]|nr:sigma-70 family RNA polymerase sigma factor [Chthonomonas sp.]